MGGGASKKSLERKTELLKGTPFFTFFETDEQLKQCAKHFVIQDIPEGEYLSSSCFLIVVEGELALSTLVPNHRVKDDQDNMKNTKQHVSELLAIKKAGDFFSKAGKELAAEGSQKIKRNSKIKGSAEKVVTTFDFTTVRALVNTRILKLDAAGKRAYLDSHANEAGLIENILNTDIKQMLKPIPFLKGLSHTRLTSLAELFSYETYLEGQVVIKESNGIVEETDYDDHFYLVLQGTLDVTAAIAKHTKVANSVSQLMEDDDSGLEAIPASDDDDDDEDDEVEEKGGAGAEEKRGEGGFSLSPGSGNGIKIASPSDLRNPQKVAVLRPQPSLRLLRKSSTMNEEKNVVDLAALQPGSYFGEMGMMVKIPRTATVTARNRCLLAKMRGTEFQNFLKLCPEIQKCIDEDVRMRMVSKLYAFRLPFFAGIQKEKLLELSNLCTLQQDEKGTVLMEEGKNTGTFFIVISGMVNVIKGGRTVVRLAEGAYFGEISMLTGKPHRATVQAHSHVVLLAITKEGFDTFFKGSEQLLAEFQMRMLGQNELDLKLLLTHPLGREYFQAHVQSEHSEEHLDFYESVAKFRKGQDTYERICKEFIGGDSNRPINVIDSMWQRVLDAPQPPPITVFDECEEETFKLMKRDNFARFKNSALMTELMSQICCYSAEDLEINEADLRRADMSFGRVKVVQPVDQ